MRLLFVDFTLPFLLRDSDRPVGGFAVQLNSWLVGLTASGHRAGVLTWKGASAYAAGPSPCDLLDTYDPDKGIRVLKYFYSYVPSMLSAARSYQPDVLIQACAGVNTGIMAYIANQLDVPFVNRVAHDAETDDRLAEHLPKHYERIAYAYGMRCASAILCQNGYQRDHLALRFPAHRLRVIHNPFAVPGDLAEVEPREKRRYIAWLAVFRDGKNLPMLVRLAKRLPQVVFRVAGKQEGNSSKDVAEAVAELGALPNVEMVGYLRRGQIPEFLSGAVALLSTSDAEGFSNTFLESFCAGTPVVLRRQVDPDSAIETNDLGLVAPDEQGLVDNLNAMWTMPAPDYDVLARHCRQYVLAHHDPVSKVGELMTVLNPLVGRGQHCA
jgi:glycosyltransferase involved in cell wall biosynthesis